MQEIAGRLWNLNEIEYIGKSHNALIIDVRFKNGQVRLSFNTIEELDKVYAEFKDSLLNKLGKI